MSIKVGQIEMQRLSEVVNYMLHDDKKRKKQTVGFVIITFDFGDVNSMINYASNAERESMLDSLEKLVVKMKELPGDRYDIANEN